MIDRNTEIRTRLENALHPTELILEDQSQQHVGHAGAAHGAGHFAVKIVSEAFRGKSVLERHRMIYKALGELMETDIHALSIKALEP